jgi:hypothetical protein
MGNGDEGALKTGARGGKGSVGRGWRVEVRALHSAQWRFGIQSGGGFGAGEHVNPKFNESAPKRLDVHLALLT